jgi:hypothetical protein
MERRGAAGWWTRWFRGLRLKEGVDERGDCGYADYEDADEEQEAGDGDDPPGFVLACERPEFAEEGNEVFERAHGAEKTEEGKVKTESCRGV